MVETWLVFENQLGFFIASWKNPVRRRGRRGIARRAYVVLLGVAYS